MPATSFSAHCCGVSERRGGRSPAAACGQSAPCASPRGVGRTIAVIRVSLFHKLLGCLRVQIQALRLNVGSVGAALIRPLIPFRPSQRRPSMMYSTAPSTLRAESVSSIRNIKEPRSDGYYPVDHGCVHITHVGFSRGAGAKRTRTGSDICSSLAFDFKATKFHLLLCRALWGPFA